MDLKVPIEQHRLWRLGKGGSQPVLRSVDLRGADLRNADLRNADLSKADLREVNLRDTILRGANLRNADLRGADLRKVDLRFSDLRGADLKGADLHEVDLSGADLRSADLGGTAGLWGLLEQMAEASRIYTLLQNPENRLEMDYWHSCDTAHCIAGWSCIYSPNPGAEASRKIPLLARFFYSSNKVAMQSLSLLAQGDIEALNNLEHC